MADLKGSVFRLLTPLGIDRIRQNSYTVQIFGAWQPCRNLPEYVYQVIVDMRQPFADTWSPVRGVSSPHSFPLRHTTTPVRGISSNRLYGFEQFNVQNVGPSLRHGA
jgi:hypothetical protein